MSATWEISNDKAGWGRVARNALLKASLASSVQVCRDEADVTVIKKTPNTISPRNQVECDEGRLSQRKVIAEMEKFVEDTLYLEAESKRAVWETGSLSSSYLDVALEPSYCPKLDYAAVSAAAAIASAKIATEVQLQLKNSAAHQAAEIASVKARAAILSEGLDSLRGTASDVGLLSEVEVLSKKIEAVSVQGQLKDLEPLRKSIEKLATTIAAAVAEQKLRAVTEKPPNQPEVTETLVTEVSEDPVDQSDTCETLVTETSDAKEEVDKVVNRLEERKRCVEYLSKYLANKEAKVEEIANGTKWKTLRRDCQRAINLAVNAISATSSSHLKDKFSRLCDLLDGRNVPLAGGESFCARNAHPHAIDFCTLILARKMVKVGEDVVSSHPDTAFAVAAVTARLTGRFPRLAVLVMAQFHRTCRLLVPMSGPPEDLTPGARDDEEHDKWLKRMSGTARMMGAILVSRSDAKKSPWGIAEAWAWLATFLGIEPLPDISATLLLDILEVTGHRLLSHYGCAFQKLLYLVCTNYVPRVEAVTPAGRGGPVQRLKTFLEDVIRDQRIPAPKGLLPRDFW